MEEQDKKKLEAVKLRMEKLAEELEKHNKAFFFQAGDGIRGNER